MVKIPDGREEADDGGDLGRDSLTDTGRILIRAANSMARFDDQVAKSRRLADFIKRRLDRRSRDTIPTK